ncbi:MAG: bifunctional [glutamine synthetase] adenylyltransferase/[glutamine synthetase]-adenylyl-L-tyrosine phosphorylase [Acidimicrobiales bacterium]
MTGTAARRQHLADLDDAVERSAAPGPVRTALDRLEAAHPGLAVALDDEEALCRVVVAVVAASRSLTLLLETDAGALDVLGSLATRPRPPEGPSLDEENLRRWKAREYLRIAARDLAGTDSLPVTAAALSSLADDVLAASCSLAGAADVVVVGMGKLGGGELNYASDIDVVFAGDGEDVAATGCEPAVREAMRVARRCFRVDANLRPEGRDGPLVRSVASFRAYWRRWASPWEFQALLKARPVTGPPELAAAFAAAAGEALWSRPLPADDLRSLRAMKARTEAEVTRRGMAARELKRGPGGIRDIEFSVQLLQLVHGRADPALRSPTTLDALAELGAAGYVDAGDAAALDDAYRFLRTVEHRVQLVDGRQVHAVPGAAGEREWLARVLGFRGSHDATALARFDAELAQCRSRVRSIHERLYFRPLMEAYSSSGARGPMSEEVAEARLEAFGFTGAERTRQAVHELTRGLTRSSRLMHQLLPLLLGWLADSPDPDQGLLGLRTLASGSQRSSELVRAFRESPETARRLCIVLGTSRMLGEHLHHNPDLISDLGDDDALAARTTAELAEQATNALRWRQAEGHNAGLKRFKEREVVRIGGRDLVGSADVDEIAVDLTALAEATLVTAVEALDPRLPFAVVALGRFGGAELSYASDLDVVFVYDGSDASDFAEAERLAAALLRLLKGTTPAGRIYLLDADLRPEGRQGPLARSLDGYRAYFERWAQVWERQAMARARPVAGDVELGQRLLDDLAPLVWDRPLGEAGVREIRRSKARVERERIPAGEDPQFHLKLGRGSLSDVEFCAQLLQLQHRVPAPGTIEALARLVEAGALAGGDAEVLGDAYRFCERARNRLYLLQGARADSLPQSAEELARLARSLDTSPVELREHYRRVTRRARTVVERVFYGRAP